MITIDSDYVSYIGKTENKGMENIRTEDIFYIDSSSRQIIVPDSWTAVGTLQDHLAEKVWFAVDRFFDDRDFLVDSNQIMVNYINAASEGYVYNCGEVYVWDPASNEVLEATPGTAPTGDELQRYNKVLFAWRISQNVTKKTGKITFAVRIGKFTVDIQNSEVGVDPEEQDWIWNTTIASLTVLESISSATGLDDDGNEWGIGDISRWFKSLSIAGDQLMALFNLISGLERVAVGPEGSFPYEYYGITTAGNYDKITATSVRPPFEVPNVIQTITTAGTLTTANAPWKYQLWVNTDPNENTVIVPLINDGAPTTEDVWSSSKTSAVINATSTADRAYADSKILSTTAAGGTTAAWATNPTTSYIQAQFGTSSATAATSGMSASGIRDYVKAQFTTTSNISSSAGWTSSATKDYADSKIVNNPANTSTSVGLSASAVKDFMSTNYLTTADASTTYLTTADAAATYLTTADAAATYLTTADAATNYLSTAAIDDTATTAVDKVWSANKVAEYVGDNSPEIVFEDGSASMTYNELVTALNNNININAKYSVEREETGIPAVDKDYYINLFSQAGITLTYSDFDGYKYSFLLRNNFDVTNANRSLTLCLCKYDGFILKGAVENSKIIDVGTIAHYFFGGSNDNNGIAFKDATWSNGETVMKVIRLEGDSFGTFNIIASSNSSGSYTYQYSNGYYSGSNWSNWITNTNAYIYSSGTNPGYKGSLVIGSNTTLHRANSGTYIAYGSYIGELTPELAPDVISKIVNPNRDMLHYTTSLIYKTVTSTYVKFIFKDGIDNYNLNGANYSTIKILTFNNDNTYTVEDGSGFLLSPSSSDVDKYLKYTSSGFEWSNIPNELPTVTTADVGKVLIVDANGEWTVGSIS